MVVDPATPDFINFLPNCIAYAEKRIYRQADFVNTTSTSTGVLTKNDRRFTLPPATYGNYITIQGVNVLAFQQRVQLQPVSTSYLNAVWGTPATANVPQFFSVLTQDVILLGPYPNDNYGVEIFGTFRPQPLSPTNTTTYLTEYLPDVFLAASMVFASGYMKDFGSQADNPQQAQSWENQFNLLFTSANMEALRQKYAGPAWTSLSAVNVSDTR
jgi:hypothetical protein